MERRRMYFLWGKVWLASTFLLVLACKNLKKETPPDQETVETSAPVVEYGIETDSFIVVKDKINKHENLSHILLRHNIPYPVIDELVKQSEDVFDVRKIATGRPYTVYCTKDSNQVAKCFIYENSQSEYIVFDMRSETKVYKGEKPVEVKIREVGGTITSSLYLTLEKQGISPALAVELSEIYAWSIDFYRIQKGDWFKVVFEEKYVDEQSIGIGKILAANFNHYDEDHYAIYYEYDDVKGYFDEKGRSAKKAFLQAPVKFSRISSGYSRNRFHPVLKRNKPHLGTDYAAPHGTPIMAVGDGDVIEARYKGGNGNYVKIKHNSTYTTQYLHMSKFAKGIKVGKRVKQGDIIGYVGSTGLATGPHVCFRFWKNGRQVDHRREKMPPSKPVDSKYIDDFNQKAKEWKNKLDAINSKSLNT